MVKQIRKRVLAMLMTLAMVVSLMPALTLPAKAVGTTIYVNSSTGNDTSGDGSTGNPYKTFTKGYAIADSGDTLDLTGTFTLTDADETGAAAMTGFTIAKNITLRGHAGQTVIQAASSSGENTSRIFTINNGTLGSTPLSVTINELELKNGYLAGGDDGGAILIACATVTINDCYIHHNSARQGFAIYSSRSHLIINNSTIANNSYSPAGSGNAGGAICADSDGGSTQGVTITNSTVTGNTGAQYGGGLLGTRGVYYVTNCTFAYNSCDLEGAGISIGGGEENKGHIYIKNTIVADNISRDNPAEADFDDKYDGLTYDNGNNIIEFHNSTTLTGSTITGDQASLNLSESLAGNNTLNAVPTLALSAGSVAINAGSSGTNGAVTVPSTDQRGFNRDASYDIGAFEFGASAPTTAPTVTTASISACTSTTATGNGNVTASGGETVTEAGLVYSTNSAVDPVIGGEGVTKIMGSATAGAFTASLTGLSPNTTYYVRAFAKNSVGTSYGSVVYFTTDAITASISATPALTEENLDTNSLSVTLSGTTFLDGTLNPSNFTLNNAPTGVTVENVTYTDATHCTVNLVYDGTDFDSNVTNFSLTIAAAELASDSNLTSNALTITATVETAPTVTTTSVSTYTETTATMGGNVTADGGETVSERGVVYSSTDAPPTIGEAGVTKDTNGTGTGNFSEPVTGLSPNTTYHVRAYAINSVGTSYGSLASFTTSPAVPTATTGTASSITSTAATLSGTVNANNASTTVTFEYGLTTAYGSSVTASPSPVTGTSSTSVSGSITGLVPNSTYHFRVKAVNSAGTTNGSDQTFTTSAIAPTATTGAASSISSTAATLNGTVNANNASTTVTFEYGLTTAYGSSATAAQSPVTGTSATSVSAALSGLVPNTTYHYRAVGVNTAGTTLGSDATFTTSAVVPTATTGAASSITSTAATLSGTVNANNASTTVTFEYGLTTAYGSSVTASQSPVTGTSSTSVSGSITGLVPNSTYHFRVKAVNSAGTTNGSDQTFTTSAIAPTATTGAASSITSTAATLNGTVNANNAETTVTFEYGTTTGYGSTATASQSPVNGTGNTSVSFNIADLTPNTTYHYRLKTVNQAGTTYGSDMTFSTDVTAPTIMSASRTDDTHITVTLSEPCQNLIKANDGGFTVMQTGAPGTQYSVSAITQGSDASHVVLTVANLGVSAKEGVTVKYTAEGNGTVADTFGNAMATNGTGVSIAPWDTAAPTIQSGTLSDENTYIDITFSEGVYGDNDGTTALTPSSFSLTFSTNGGTATNASILSVKTNTGAGLTGGEPIVRVFLTVTGTPNGLETIEIKPATGTSIYDKAGNSMQSSQTSGVKQLNDKTPPTVSSVSVPAAKKYKAGETLSFTVNFSKAVTVTGTPTLALDIGGTAVNAAYVSGDNTSALVFAYTIVDGNTDTNGIDVGALSLNLGTIKDAAGNDATLTLNSVASTTGVLVDTTAPAAGNTGTIGISELTYNSAKLTWTAATDPGTLAENLQYKAVFSTGDITDVDAANLLSPNWTSNISTLTVTGLTASTAYCFNVLVKDEAGNMALYSQVTGTTTAAPVYDDSPSTPATPANSAVVEVNGEKQDAGTSSTTTTDGQRVTTITVDDTKLDRILESSGEKPTVTLPSTGSAVTVGELNGQTVKNMENKEATLEIKTDTATYTLPAAQINIDAVSALLGSQVELKDIKVSVKIAEPAADTVKIVEDTANKGGYQLVVKPVAFEINCTNGDQTVEVSRFNGYVERTIAIPDGIDPSKITTGIVLNADGTFSHVPTQIIVIDGKYYAKINSLTNSTYSVVYNPVIFSDMASHWAKEAVNDMGSRMVVTGIGNGIYEPERSITRAEFAAIVVRALGLKKGSTESAFGDVTRTDWFNGYVDTATSYALITGYDSTKYAPNDTITREQAMTILARAMKLTGLSVTLTDSESSALLANYSDAGLISDYARAGAAACVKTGVVSGTTASTLSPKDSVTRAEVGVMVSRLLEKSGLI